MDRRNDGAWFAPRRHGIGSNWPVAWQGWASLALYLAAITGTRALDKLGGTGPRIAAFLPAQPLALSVPEPAAEAPASKPAAPH